MPIYRIWNPKGDSLDLLQVYDGATFLGMTGIQLDAYVPFETASDRGNAHLFVRVHVINQQRRLILYPGVFKEKPNVYRVTKVE